MVTIATPFCDHFCTGWQENLGVKISSDGKDVFYDAHVPAQELPLCRKN